MAITKIHPIRADVQKAVDYICNPEKTNGELLVDSFACSPKTAGVEFDMALNYGSRRGSNKAFHLIPNFFKFIRSPHQNGGKNHIAFINSSILSVSTPQD